MAHETFIEAFYVLNWGTAYRQRRSLQVAAGFELIPYHSYRFDKSLFIVVVFVAFLFTVGTVTTVTQDDVKRRKF